MTDGLKKQKGRDETIFLIDETLHSRRDKGRFKSDMGLPSTLLLSFLSLGIGILGGFGWLYVQYNDECHSLLQKANADHVVSSQDLQKQYNQIQSSYQSCLQKESESQRACQEKSSQSLEAHSSLAKQYQKLVQEHAHALARVSTVEKEEEVHLQNIQSLQEHIKSLQKSQEQFDRKMEVLQHQLSMTQNMLQQKIQEVEQLEESGGGTGGNVFVASKALSDIKVSIQRQYWSQLWYQYESRGPFQIAFTLDVGGDDQIALVAELSTLESFSTTVRTALRLVDEGLYVGTTVQLDETSDLLLTGGNPQNVESNRIQANLKRRLAEHGYGMEPFLWVELSSEELSDCATTPGAFWFPSQGAHFSVTLPPPGTPYSEEDSTRSSKCTGRIVQGLSKLQQVFTHTNASRNKVTIVNARVIVPGKQEEATKQREEL